MNTAADRWALMAVAFAFIAGIAIGKQLDVPVEQGVALKAVIVGESQEIWR